MIIITKSYTGKPSASEGAPLTAATGNHRHYKTSSILSLPSSSIIIIAAVQDNYSFPHQEIRGETKHVESWWFERLLLVASTKSPTKWLNFQQKKLNFSWFGRALLVTRTRQWLNFIFSFIRCSFSYGVMMFIFMTSFWVQFLKIPQ